MGGIATLRRLWARLRGRGTALSSTLPYRAYTTRFDLEIHASELPRYLGREGRRGEKAFRSYVAGYDNGIAGWRAAADIAAVESVARVRAAWPAGTGGHIVGSLLIDHSGSMRGPNALLGTALAEVVGDYWGRLGMPFEVLGFTTRSWHGGRSRKLWRWAGQPPNPGRLCDLLHIVYRAAGEPPSGVPWSVRNLMRRALLKENIDGEAVQWASHRLRQRPERRKLLLVLSDGAPVDDSTLLANDLGILTRHLHQVVAELRAAGDIELGGVGLQYDVSRYYPHHVIVATPDDIASKLVPFLEWMLLQQPTRTPPPAGDAENDFGFEF